MEKNKIRIFLFTLIHVILEFSVLIILIPCKNIIYCLNFLFEVCENNKNYILDYIYITFFFVVFSLYIILLYLDPGKKKKNLEDNLLVKII